MSQATQSVESEPVPLPHRRFLQTALFVDDEALRPHPVAIPQQIEVPRSGLTHPKEASGTGSGEPETEPDPSEQSEADRDPEGRREVDVDITQQIVEGFADIGVTCAVLAPDRLGEPRRNQIDKLARRTDVLVLDWNIGSTGAGLDEEDVDPTALGLIERIVKQDADSGGRLRLIAIYTSESDLDSIVADLMERLTDQFDDDELTATANKVNGPHLLITLYQKPLREDRPGLPTGIAPKELIESILEDFDEVCARGLFQQLALTVMSSVRDQASRVLARFDSDLDPALIGHRAQTSHRDAIVFALALLGSELSSLVRTADISSVMSEQMVAKHVDRLIGEGERSLWVGKGEVQAKTNDLTRNYLTRPGEDNARSGLGVSAKARTVSSLMLDADNDDALQTAVREVEYAFAVLCCAERSAAFDGDASANPTLEFGTLIENDGQYFLCLQPVCDSVRVTEPREFIFLPMRRALEPMSFDLIVLEGQHHVPLVPDGPSLASTRGLMFLGDPVTFVVSAERSGDSRRFFTTDQQGWRWVASIREAYVRRILSRMIESMTRVGLDESEFMHLGK